MHKILYVTNQICGAAGLERVLSIKTNYLIEHYGYEIHIITLNQGKEPLFYNFNSQIIYHDIIAKGNPITYFLNYYRGLNKIVEKIKPDIISVCDDGLKGFFVPRIIKKPCPMIYERHVSKNIQITEDKVSFINIITSNITYKLMHFGAKSYDKFVVLTNDNLNEWHLQNLAVISNPLSFNPKEKSNLSNKVVLAVGRQSYQKGYDRLLKIWQKVTKNHPDWQLKIYGKIDESLELEKLAETLGVKNSVVFYNPVKNIDQVYLNASVYVMSSRFEGFGMVLIEAMACGLPVISFDCPCGPKDIIANNEDGFLIHNGDFDKFSNALQTLIKNESLRIDMGAKAKQNITRFMPEEIVPQWDKLFKNLLK